MDLVMACHWKTRGTNAPCTYLVLLASVFLNTLLHWSGQGHGQALQATCSNTWIGTIVHAMPGISLSAGHGYLSTRPCTTIHNSCLHGSIQTHSMGLITSLYRPGTRTFPHPGHSCTERGWHTWSTEDSVPRAEHFLELRVAALIFRACEAQDLVGCSRPNQHHRNPSLHRMGTLWALSFSLLQSHCAYSSANDSSRHSSSCALCWFSAEQSVLLIRNGWEWRPAHTAQWRAVISLPFPQKNTQEEYDVFGTRENRYLFPPDPF